MDHGICWFPTRSDRPLCGRPAKSRCTNPVTGAKLRVCGIHKRWYASRGWVITDLEREAKMKEDSNG